MCDNSNSVVNQLSPVPVIDLLNDIQAGVLVLNRERRFLFTNNWLPERIGKPALWFLENSLDDLPVKGSWTEADRALSILFGQGENVRWYSTIPTGQTAGLFVEFLAVPIYRDGVVFAAQLTCVDVSTYQDAVVERDEYREAFECQAQEIGALHCIGEAGTLTLDQVEVVSLVYAQVKQLFAFSHFALVLYEVESQSLLPALVVINGVQDERERWLLDDDEGLIGLGIRSQSGLLIQDRAQSRQWPIEQDRIVQEDMRSWLSVPLVVQEQVLGLICLQSAKSYAFTASDQASLQALAGQIAIVMENARLHQQAELQLEELQQANREMQALQDLSGMLQSSLDLRNVFQVVVNGLVSGLGYRLAMLAIVDDRDNTLVVRSFNTARQDVRGNSATAIGSLPDVCVSLDDQENVIVRALLEGRITTLHSLDDLAPFLYDAGVKQALQDELLIHSVVVVPLLAQGKLVGSFFTGIAQPELAGREVALLSAFANQSAIAIQNARLYSTVNQRLTEVSMLYTLANEVSYSLDLDVVLDSIVNTLKRVLDCRSSCIFLFDKENQWLSIQASSGIKPKWQRDARMRLGEGIAGMVAKEAKPRYIPDTFVDPDFITFDPSVRSLLVVPLMVAGRVIGTLNVDDSKPNAFSSDEGRLLSIAAAQVAVQIDNARLYNDLKERADKLAQAYEELQEASRLKSEFVQNVSHELRTPLTFVKAYVDLLLENTLGPLSEHQREKLEIVSNRTDSIVQLVDDIFSLQKLERDQLRLVPLSMEQVAHVSLQGAELRAHAGGLELAEDFEPGLQQVMGDGIRLTQVFDNLIHNAIKFSPDGGTITVRIRSDDRYAHVEVIDPGIGIPKDKQDKIFERFYQVDGSSKRRFGGTGLGLAIVKEIVQAHGGTVSVQSEEGQGSTFGFWIPFVPPESGANRQNQFIEI